MSVSACIPTYNQAPYLAEAIDSVLQQPEVGEIVVSDDGSTDETERICREFACRLPHFRYIRQPKTLGMVGNTDFVLRQGTSKWIIGLDSDDRLLPGYARSLRAVLECHSEAAYAHGDVWEIDGHGRRGAFRCLARPAGFQAAKDSLKASLLGYRVTANIVMFRREALAALGYVTNRPDYVKDYHLAVAFARRGWGNAYLPEPVAEYRVWRDGAGFRLHRKEREIEGLIATFVEEIEPAWREAGWPPRPISRARRRMALRHAPILADRAFGGSEKEALERRLLELGDSLRLRASLALIRAGYGFVLVASARARNRLVNLAKGRLRMSLKLGV